MRKISEATNKLSLAQAALFYGQGGWPIFPLTPRGKQPLTSHGLNDASRDRRVIERWWARYPAANIGLACGLARLVVVDVDPAHGGFEAWADVDPGVRTLSSRTGGGCHYVYAAPAGVVIRSSAGKLGPGLDVRASGGYIVLPPSIHPNGRAYEWIDLTGIAPLPAGLVALLTKRGTNQTPDTPRMGPRETGQDSFRRDAAQPKQLWETRRGRAPAFSRYARAPNERHAQSILLVEVGRVRGARVGTRHDTLIRAAFVLGRLVGGHMLDLPRVEHYLLEAALAGGLPLSEARRTIADGLVAGLRQPRTGLDEDGHEAVAV